MTGTKVEGGTPTGSIDFGPGPIEFRTLTLLVDFDYGTNQTGTNVELTRKSMSVDKITIGVKIY